MSNMSAIVYILKQISQLWNENIETKVLKKHKTDIWFGPWTWTLDLFLESIKKTKGNDGKKRWVQDWEMTQAKLKLHFCLIY